LPASLQARLARTSERVALVRAQRAALDAAQQACVRAAPAESALARLARLKGVAATSAAVLLDEGLLWREFRNRREIGGCLGFTPTPYASGDTAHEQGISRAGNNRLQVISIQLAWNWVLWQPQSALSRWYHVRFGVGKRARRIGIVALARKLVIALWRYATTGMAPTGAILKIA
jgi:transposase